ncbi:MAG TPA: lactate racemase domain-containing protein, partial [Kofleriaceae bacterium]
MRAIRPKLRSNPREHIVTIDTDSAPRIMFSGENLIMEDLPVGTRVIYPNRPMTPVANPVAAIRYALNHPEDSEPLHALLTPGMKVTIAVDDISMPLPIMRTPDVRELVLEIVCEMLADHGVDDVHIIIALGLHRRMHDWEIKRMVGQKVWDEYWPDRLYNHDGCDPDGMVLLGKTQHGEIVEMNKRVAESDLTIYVNLNFVPMNGGHKSMAVGLFGYESLKAHHTPHGIVQSNSYMDPPKSYLSHSFKRQGDLVEKTLKVFHIETVLNNRAFDGPLSFLNKNEDDFTEADRLKYQAMKWSLDKLPFAARREIFMRTPAAYEMIACYAGGCDPVHDKTLAKQNEQNCVEVDGPADIMIYGIPYISPYNVNSKALNPLLVQVMALGYFYHMYRNQPILRDGGVLIITHPCSDKFDPVHHPSYIEFFNRLLPETRDAYTLEKKYQDEFAYNPSYVEMYRRGNAYHGAHPFYMWYWGQAGREWLGKIIVVGSDNATVPKMMGWDRADTLSEAISMARSFAGRSASITM